jgi:hypothetical protein
MLPLSDHRIAAGIQLFFLDGGNMEDFLRGEGAEWRA